GTGALTGCSAPRHLRAAGTRHSCGLGPALRTDRRTVRPRPAVTRLPVLRNAGCSGGPDSVAGRLLRGPSGVLRLRDAYPSKETLLHSLGAQKIISLHSDGLISRVVKGSTWTVVTRAPAV